MSASQVFVIHLARATARRENAEALLAGCGMDGEIWPAVDGAAMAEASVKGSSVTGFSRRAIPLRSNPASWAVSSVIAPSGRRSSSAVSTGRWCWKMTRRLTPTCIRRPCGLRRRMSANLGYIQLQNRPPAPFHHIATDGACVLGQATLTPLRTTAQAVSRAAAERLLSLSDRIDRPVDSFLQSHWHTGLRLGTIYPSGISSVDAALAGSTIQGGTRSLSQTLSREWRRFRYRGQVARAARDSGAPEVKP
jgi:glycosyl transferase family 25